MRGDCWGTWLIMLGFMDLGWPRVCRRSTAVLSQIFSTGFASFLFYMLIRGTFRCISMMCPLGPISGLLVKVAVDLVRPSGLLSYMKYKHVILLWFHKQLMWKVYPCLVVSGFFKFHWLKFKKCYHILLYQHVMSDTRIFVLVVFP